MGSYSEAQIPVYTPVLRRTWEASWKAGEEPISGGHSIARYAPRTAATADRHDRVFANDLQAVFNERVRIRLTTEPLTVVNPLGPLSTFAWSHLNDNNAALFKGVRDALKGENIEYRNAGHHRGKGPNSTAVVALNWPMYVRVRAAYTDYGERVLRDVDAPFLHGIPCRSRTRSSLTSRSSRRTSAARLGTSPRRRTPCTSCAASRAWWQTPTRRSVLLMLRARVPTHCGV